jgi:hypothetical protein
LDLPDQVDCWSSPEVVELHVEDKMSRRIGFLIKNYFFHADVTCLQLGEFCKLGISVLGLLFPNLLMIR